MAIVGPSGCVLSVPGLSSSTYIFVLRIWQEHLAALALQISRSPARAGHMQVLDVSDMLPPITGALEERVKDSKN